MGTDGTRLDMDDFDRDVYCLLGLPFDAVGMKEAIVRLRASIAGRKPCFLSTPNLNFLIGCQDDAIFRDSVVNSDLSVADGMPLVWMAKLLGIPIRERVAGSCLFEALHRGESASPGHVSVYFFGGQEGAAEAACAKLDAGATGLRCAGFGFPGFGSVEEMSSEEVIAGINASGADFLVVSLGAKKGHAWIERNRSRISVPVISHLGAVVNFEAGSISRAPGWMQKAGLEWLWRIKEEPLLWKRYWNDGMTLPATVLACLLPYALWLRFAAARPASRGGARFEVEDDRCRLLFEGAIPDPVPQNVRQALREAADRCDEIVLDCSAATYFGPGLFGLLLMLRKRQLVSAKPLRFIGVSPRLRQLFRWNGVEYLLP